VEDGEQALSFLKQDGEFDEAPTTHLLLLDWNLPRVHGRDVLNEIKSSPALKHLPVVILTTSEAEGDVLQAYQLHANCFITKPQELNEYQDTVALIEQFWMMCVKLPGVAS
jgi:CheY-like chemotaxis protein